MSFKDVANIFRRGSADARAREATQPGIPAETRSPLDQPLVWFSQTDAWRIRDACEGTQIFGATGSGKTSGSGRAIAKAFLSSGFGGLVLTAKKEDRALWEQYCSETGRSDALIVVSPSEPWRFNFLDYELRRPGLGAGDTENLVRLFFTVLEISEGRRGAATDPFWERAARQMLRNAIDLLTVAKGRLILSEIYDVITSAPTSMEEVNQPEWQERSFCFHCAAEGLMKSGGTAKEHDFMLASKYWLREFPTLAEKTRSVIVTTFTSMADCFLRGKLRELFCTTTNILPEHTHQGHVILLDLPVKEYGEIGRFAQVLFKYVWQGATERRDVNENPRPVFLWADEAQYFVTSLDKDFQMTARSSRACTVFLTQNLPNYHAMLGGDKAAADSLLGNFQTTIFHANGDATTNQWAAELIAKSFHEQYSGGSSTGGKDQASSRSTNFSQSLEYDVQPQDFTRLRKGGPESGCMVDSIIFRSGTPWRSTGKNFVKATFDQRN